MRIIVMGGGIGGLTATIALHRVGVDVHLYEQAAELREVGAGITLAANALRALDALDLADEVRSQSIARVQGGVRKPTGEFLISIPADDFSKHIGTVAVMHRAELLALLARRVDPGRLHLGCACVGIQQDENGIAVHLNTGKTVQADGLVAADGLRSTVRAQMFSQPAVRYAGYTAWRAVVGFTEAHKLILGETWGRGRRFGMVPMAGGRVYWFATNNSPPDQRDPPGRTKQSLAELFRGWHEPINALITAAHEDSILRNDIYDIVPLPRFVQETTALLGDAAHAMTPDLGQGACQAIEDSVVLAACLKKAGRVEPALLEYERRRMPRTQEILLRSRQFGIVAQLQNPALCWLRDSGLRMTPKGVASRQTKSLLQVEILTPAERSMLHSRSV